MITIGIDLGGTGIKVGAVSPEGGILSKAAGPTLPERGPEAVIKDMVSLTRKAVKEAGTTLEAVTSIGIGVPGIEDPARGIVPFLTNLGWHEIPMRSIFQSMIDKPIFVTNDAVAAALAESVAGVSKGTKSSVMVTLGTGLGGGVIIDGKPFLGAHGVASEIGHMAIKFDGEMCTCGKRGCFERYASASALIREGKRLAAAHPESLVYKSVQGEMENITAKTVIDAAKAGDDEAMKLFDKYVFWLCTGLVNLINTYDPEMLVLGGGVSAAGTFLLDPVRERLPELVFYKTMPYARIELATLGNDAGIIGAGMLRA